MHKEFSAGDVVYLLPYDQVMVHWGISKSTWDKQVEKNPQLLIWKYAKSSNGACGLYDDHCHFLWPECAFVHYEGDISLPDVEDLI